MFVEELNLIGYRNYLEARIRFSSAKTIIIGKNAQGKTNLLEVIQILSGLRSRRATKDSELINFELETAVIQAKTSNDKINIVIRPSGRRGIKVNDVTKSNRELNKLVSSVSFMVNDLELVSGSPGTRRDWLDDFASQLDSSYLSKLEDFEKMLRQRNGYISKLVETGTYYARLNSQQASELALWDELYIKTANIVIAAREELLAKLRPVAAKHYSAICQNPDEKLSLDYLGSPLSQEELTKNLAKDFARMHSTIGPQRHDINITINTKAAGSYASQGQRRSVVLAIKLTELELLREANKSEPILLLDDVLAELDQSRQVALLNAISPDTQVIITSTGLGEHLEAWSQEAQIIEVVNGSIKQYAQIA